MDYSLAELLGKLELGWTHRQTELTNVLLVQNLFVGRELTGLGDGAVGDNQGEGCGSNPIELVSSKEEETLERSPLTGPQKRKHIPSSPQRWLLVSASPAHSEPCGPPWSSAMRFGQAPG